MTARRIRPASTGKMIAGFVILLGLSPVLAQQGEPEPTVSSWCDDRGAIRNLPECAR